MGRAVVTNNVNICYQNLINQHLVVVEPGLCNGIDRDDKKKTPNEFISLFYSQSYNTKLMISVMN